MINLRVLPLESVPLLPLRYGKSARREWREFFPPGSTAGLFPDDTGFDERVRRWYIDYALRGPPREVVFSCLTCDTVTSDFDPRLASTYIQ